MKVIFLGTNGWYDTPTGNTPSVLIDTGKEYIVLDAGFGFYKVKEHVKSERPVSLFISHLHLDHLIGLHTLPIFNLPQGIDIYLPKKFEKAVRGLLKRPYTSPPLLLPTKLRFHDALAKADPGFAFEALPLKHSVPCYGYRFSLGAVTVAYCTDTGPCNNLKRLAAGASLLIIECALEPDYKGVNLFHVTPQTAARVAKEAGAKKMALFHFDPARYPSFARRLDAEGAAKEIFAQTIAANDGTTIDL